MLARRRGPRSQERYMSNWITHFQPIVALVAGVLILVTPRFINWIVALYLILIGASGLGVLK
jgi:hypothetical protein